MSEEDPNAPGDPAARPPEQPEPPPYSRPPQYGQPPVYGGPQPPPYGDPPPSWGPPPQYGQPTYGQPQYGAPHGQPPFGAPVPGPAYGAPAGKPDNYMLWAILATIFGVCSCVGLGLGIAAIVFANRVNTRWAVGDRIAAAAYSQKAKNFAIGGLMVDALGLIFGIALNAARNR